jgi:TFIIF-interacting CTD phosphatase-like protein
VVGREKVVYIKDINVLCNCDQSKIVVVDDTPIAYCLNPDNAVPILPYFGESFDNGLFFLSKTLLEVKDYEDVREYIRGRYTFNINSL